MQPASPGSTPRAWANSPRRKQSISTSLAKGLTLTEGRLRHPEQLGIGVALEHELHGTERRLRCLPAGVRSADSDLGRTSHLLVSHADGTQRPGA